LSGDNSYSEMRLKRVQKSNRNWTTKFGKAAQFFVTSSQLMAVNSVFLVYFVTRLYGIEVQPILLLQIFFGNIAVYSLNKITDKKEDRINKPNQTSTFQKYFITATIICYGIILIIGIIDGINYFLVLVTPLLIGYIYSVKIFKKLPRLKEILGVKSIAVASSLAFTFTVLPSLTDIVTLEKVVLVFVYIFIQLFVNVLIFDIIDMRGDEVANIKTIPLYFGKKGTTYFLYIVNSLLLIWLSICYAYGIFIRYLPIAAFGMIYSYVLIWYFTKNSSKRLLAEVIVDSEGIIIAIMLLLIVR
jgi:4-hydroxybenzoate polyprenyltransferase